MTEKCWDCGHSIARHSDSYPMGALRGVPEEHRPPKRPGEGCLIEGCPCRRWFEFEGKAPSRSGRQARGQRFNERQKP